MSSVQKLDNKKGYRAQIKVRGIRDSKVFATRREALEWAALREASIRSNIETHARDRFTLSDALRKYASEVSVTKRGARWEKIRLLAFERMELPVVPIGSIDASHIALFRDSRIKDVSPGTVLRELSLLSSVFETARLEWRWLDKNPCNDVRKPSSPKHRDCTLQWGEIKTMLKVLNYSDHGGINSKKQAIAVCFITALRTGMRAG